MASLPESVLAGVASRSSSFFSVQPPNAMATGLQSATVDELIHLLTKDQYREEAISILSKRRERYTELGITLWNSKDVVIILLQELTSIYKMLSPGQLSIRDANRVCNALALLQYMASHPDVKLPFINARIPLYIYHFLNTTSTERPFEYLRLTSLGVIGALVKVEDSNSPQVTHFLLESEVLPLCLRCMDWGDELSKTVATFILSRILGHEEGLSYCCASAERFYVVAHVMKCMIEKMGNIPLVRLLKHIIQCYLSLSEMPRACDALQLCLPMKLKDHGFINVFVEDPATMRMLEQLLYNVRVGHWHKAEPVGDVFPQHP